MWEKKCIGAAFTQKMRSEDIKAFLGEKAAKQIEDQSSGYQNLLWQKKPISPLLIRS